MSIASDDSLTAGESTQRSDELTKQILETHRYYDSTNHWEPCEGLYECVANYLNKLPAPQPFTGGFSDTHTVYGVSPEPLDHIQARRAAFDMSWSLVAQVAGDILKSVHEESFKTLTKFVHVDDIGTRVPVALVYTGLNLADRDMYFPQLHEHLASVVLSKSTQTNDEIVPYIYVVRLTEAELADIDGSLFFVLQQCYSESIKRLKTISAAIENLRKLLSDKPCLAQLEQMIHHVHELIDWKAPWLTGKRSYNGVQTLLDKGETVMDAFFQWYRYLAIPLETLERTTLLYSYQITQNDFHETLISEETAPTPNIVILLEGIGSAHSPFFHSIIHQIVAAAEQDAIAHDQLIVEPVPFRLVMGMSGTSATFQQQVNAKLLTYLAITEIFVENPVRSIYRILDVMLIRGVLPVGISSRVLSWMIEHTLQYDLSVKSFLHCFRFALLELYSKMPMSFLATSLPRGIYELQEQRAIKDLATRAVSSTEFILQQLRKLPNDDLYALRNDLNRSSKLEESPLTRQWRYMPATQWQQSSRAFRRCFNRISRLSAAQISTIEQFESVVVAQLDCTSSRWQQLGQSLWQVSEDSSTTARLAKPQEIKQYLAIFRKLEAWKWRSTKMNEKSAIAKTDTTSKDSSSSSVVATDKFSDTNSPQTKQITSKRSNKRLQNEIRDYLSAPVASGWHVHGTPILWPIGYLPTIDAPITGIHRRSNSNDNVDDTDSGASATLKDINDYVPEEQEISSPNNSNETVNDTLYARRNRIVHFLFRHHLRRFTSERILECLIRVIRTHGCTNITMDDQTSPSTGVLNGHKSAFASSSLLRQLYIKAGEPGMLNSALFSRIKQILLDLSLKELETIICEWLRCLVVPNEARGMMVETNSQEETTDEQTNATSRQSHQMDSLCLLPLIEDVQYTRIFATDIASLELLRREVESAQSAPTNNSTTSPELTVAAPNQQISYKKYGAAKRRELVLSAAAATSGGVDMTAKTLAEKAFAILQTMVARYLTPSDTLPLHECCVLRSEQNLSNILEANPRETITIGLDQYTLYLPSQQILSAETHDTVLAYSIYKYASKRINLYEWYYGFRAYFVPDGVDPPSHLSVSLLTKQGATTKPSSTSTPGTPIMATPKRRRKRKTNSASIEEGTFEPPKIDEQQEEVIKARFIQALAELQYLGLIVRSNHNTEVVNRQIFDVRQW